MQAGTATINGIVSESILDRIAEALSRMIGVNCVVEHFLGDGGTAAWKEPEQCSHNRNPDCDASSFTSFSPRS